MKIYENRRVKSKIEQSAIHSHLTITQAVIQRMAANSASSKTWCISTVSAILVIVANQGKPHYSLLAYVPATAFMFLDIYYLTIERGFRDAYNSFVKKIHDRNLKTEDLYLLKRKEVCLSLFIDVFFSVSIFIFYLAIFLAIFISQNFV